MKRSPIKWAGGKYRLRREIVDILPEHTCYVEVFGGAGWVLFAKEPSQVEVFNDIDGDLINFFQTLKNKPEELIKCFEWSLASRRVFDDLKNADISLLNDVEQAHRFFYLIMASWGGEYRDPRFQTSISDKGGHGNRLIGAIKNLEKRLEPAYKRLQTVIIENLPWEECIKRYDRDYGKNKVVMYIDPPYPNNNVNYRYNMRDMESHEHLAKVLSSVKSRFVLSSFDVPETCELYKAEGFHVKSINFASGMPSGNQRKRNEEILVTNFKF